MSQTKITLGIFVLFLLALPLASAQINDTVLYLPFETTVGEIASQPVIYDLFEGEEGHVTANDSTKYNYGWNGSIQRTGSGNAGLITLESSPQITYTAFSWNGWFKDDATDSDWAYWSAYDQNSGSEYPMMMNCYDASPCNKIQYSIATSSGTYSDTYAYTPSSTTWGMWTWTYDGSNMRLYRNGAEVDSVAATGTIDVEALLLSIRRQGTGTYLGAGKPTMDDVSFWNETLNTTQITELYNGGAGKRVDEISFPFNATWYSSMDNLMSQNAIYDNAWSAGTETLDSSYPFAFTPVAVPGIIDQADLTARSYFVKDFSPGTYAAQADRLPSWSDLGISSGDTLSISLWFKPSDQDSQSFLLGGETGSNGFQLNYYTEGVYIGSGAGSFGTSSWIYGVTANEWHLATLTFDSATTTWNLTIDNGEDTGHPSWTVGSVTLVKDWAYASSAYSLMIGADYHETAAIPAEKGFTGSLQDFTLYDYVLTGANVNSIWQSGAPTQLASEVLSSSGITYNDSLTYKTGNALEWGRASNGPRMIAPTETALEIDDSSITIAAWGKLLPDAGGTDYQLIFLNGRDEGSFGYYKMYIDDGSENYLKCAIGDTDGNSAVVANDGAETLLMDWTHYVCVFDYDTDTIYRYVNGVSTGANMSASAIDWAKLPTGYTNQIGGRLTAIGGDYDNWEGFLDEVRVYNRSLNSTEVLELYNYNQFAGEPPPPDCSASYSQFNDTPGNWTLYYPFDHTSSYGIAHEEPLGAAGKVNANVSTAWNYGYNGSVDFDGSDDGYETYVGEGTGFSEITISLWAAPDDFECAASYCDMIDSYPGSSANDEWVRLQIDDSVTPAGAFGFVADFGDDSCGYELVDYPTAGYSGWVHVLGIYSESEGKIKLYIDGVNVDNTTTSGCGELELDNDFWLGKRADGGSSEEYNGKLDEVAVFNRALNQTEIDEIYNSDSGKRVDELSFYNTSETFYYNDMDFLMGPGPNGYAGISNADLYQHTTGVPGIIGAGAQNENNWNLTAQGFNGIDDYLELGTISELVGTGDRTITFWVRPRDIGTTNNYLFAQGDQTDNEWFGIFLDGGGELEFSTFGTGDFSTGTTLVDNTWYHIAFTYDGSETIAYVDGADVYTDSYSTLNVGTDNTPILMYSPNAAFYSAGDMQDFNAYDEALSPAQITSIYQSGTPTQLIRDVYSTDLVYNNSLTYSTGTSLGFDGTSDRFEVLNDVPFPTIAGLTYSTWYWYPSTAASQEDWIFWHGDATTPNVKFYLSKKTDQTVRFQIAGSSGHRFDMTSNTTTLQSGQWNHILINGSGIGETGAPYQMWINGVKVTDCNGAPDALPCDYFCSGCSDKFPPAADEPFWLGAENDGAPAYYLEGKLDDFRFYNKSMTTTEIAAIYNHGQLSFTSDGSCVTTFGTTVDPTTVYTVDSMTCTALWESNDDPTAPTSVNFTQTWFNESLVYSQFNQTGASDGQIYNFVVPSAATLYNQNWSCEVNWTYNPTLSQTVARTIQNSLPVISGNLTWTDDWFNPLNRTFTCTDPDTTQNLTMVINDAQSNFYGAGYAADLSAYSSDINDITYDTAFWYVLDDTNDQVIKFDSSWTWIANYSLDAANTNPSGFYRDGFARWYVTDSTDNDVYEYNNNFTAIGLCAAGCAIDTKPQDLYKLGSYWFIVRDDGGTTQVHRYNWTFESKTLMKTTSGEDTDMTSMWYWGDDFFYLSGNQNDKVYKYYYNETTPDWTYIGEQTTLGYDSDCLYRDNYYWYLCKDSNEYIYQYYSNFTTYVNMSQTGPNTTSISALFNHTFVSSDVGNHYINISCNDSIGHTDNETFYQYIYTTNYTNHTAMSPANGTVWFEDPSLLCSGGTDPSNSSTYGFEYYSDTDHYLGYANADVSLSWTDATYDFHNWSCRPCLAEGIDCGAFGPQFSITPAVFDVCPAITASTSVPLLNFTFKDEMTDLPLNATAVVDVDYTSEYEAGTTQTYTFQYINTSHNAYYDFCVAPNATPMILGYQSFIYSSTEGATTYPARDFGYTYNVSSLYNQTLYLLDENTGTYSTFITVDQIEDVLPFVAATVERQNLVPGEEWTLVASGDTDASGAITFWLNPDFFHRFTFQKTGYETFQNLIKPTQPQYIIGLGPAEAQGVSTIIEGISYFLSPSQSWLVPGETHTFNLNITSVGDNLLYNCKLELYNNSPAPPSGTGTLLATTGEGCAYLDTAGLGDNLTTTLLMPDNSIYGRVSIKVNSTSSDWIILENDAQWEPINFTGSGGNSLQDFFTTLSSFNYASNTQENMLSKIWFFFLIVAILLSIFTFSTGEEWQSPLSTLWLLVAIFSLASYMGFFSPATCAFTDSAKCFFYDHYIALLFGWIFLGYLLNYLSKRSAGEL